ncbi:D-glycero-alpha-D-manno-heptose-7-phosphate kinase [Bryocella elongata]|uniref:D-glycero-alpha-D-manno-heptose-7-phosphate kinase n=1 Tax=Bryocella elongata TaxID=863522 RepID=A0A1H5SS72_9BACT|nr:galactokinase [Bryocella elongata]SEF52637.1 D-glycero-alpha-D-manno-heptose-7-phosphate kinase [Bryocella elongata]
MIITRTPLRISLGGGGTDLPSYYRQFGGFVLSAAINKYIYIAVNRPFFSGYWLKYSEVEHAASVDEIRHRLIREALKLYPVDGPFEMTSMADVPGGTGLGSSGTFAVGLVHAILAYNFRMADAELLARSAIEIEMERLNDPVGKQDQYIAAYGGLLCQEYHQDDTVTVSHLNVSQSAIHELRDSLMLFFVGNTRTASTLLDEQRKESEQGGKDMLDSLHFAKQSGFEIRDLLQTGRVLEYGSLLHEHWMRKRSRSKGMSNPVIDELYEIGRSKGGALGGKLVGAGGGGFLLFQTEDRRRLRKAMADAGADEMDFSFDFDGSVVLVRNRG